MTRTIQNVSEQCVIELCEQGVSMVNDQTGNVDMTSLATQISASEKVAFILPF